MPQQTIEEQLIKDLLEQGFPEGVAKKAVQHAPEKTIESVTEYIEQMEKAAEERSRRREQMKAAEVKEKYDNEEQKEEMKEKEVQRIKDKEYLQMLRQRILDEKKEREIQHTQQENSVLSTDTTTSGNTLKTKSVAGTNDCKIRVRFDEGGSKIFTFGKDECLSLLFDKLHELYSGKKFELCDVNLVTIQPVKKSFNDSGFFPSKVLIAKRL